MFGPVDGSHMEDLEHAKGAKQVRLRRADCPLLLLCSQEVFSERTRSLGR